MGDLTKNFSTSEIACKCGCGLARLDLRLLMLLQAVRDEYGSGVTIKSGCRCEKHNRNEGGKPTSDHLPNVLGICEGVDIGCDNSRMRHIILKKAYLGRFGRIGIGKSFIHVGGAPDNPQDVAWVY